MSVLVVGSIMTDLVTTCNRSPKLGETVLGTSFRISFGGKGANQAIAVKRMESEVKFIGCLGNDDFGRNYLKKLAEEGFDTSLIKISKTKPSGVSLITIEKDGLNRIIINPGANLDFTSDELNKYDYLVKESDYVLTQFEMADEIVNQIYDLCRKYNKPLIINPAPAKDFEKRILNGLYCITPNEIELAFIVKKELLSIDDYINASNELIKLGCENVICTLGDRGSLLVNKNETKLIPAHKVKAIDTVGAGDTYTGTLVAMLDKGYTLMDSMKMATLASALEVQKEGALDAIPTFNDVKTFVKTCGK